jgi:hypothetical protein
VHPDQERLATGSAAAAPVAVPGTNSWRRSCFAIIGRSSMRLDDASERLARVLGLDAAK